MQQRRHYVTHSGTAIHKETRRPSSAITGATESHERGQYEACATRTRGPSAFLITLGFIAAGDETTGPPSGATVTAQAAWCDLDVRVGSPLRHLNRSTAPNQAVADDRRRHGQPESTGRPGSASTRPGRDRRRGVRWRGTGGGHRPSVEYAHLSGGIRPWALRYAERDSDRLPNHHESAVGCPTPHER